MTGVAGLCLTYGMTPTPTSHPSATPLYKLVEAKLGRDPIIYARERREAGLSWAKIADEVKAKTNEYLTPEALRRWDQLATAAEAETNESQVNAA